MLLMQHHQDAIERRLYVIGIPRYTIKPFIALMVKWENGSGVEWTIKRLKSLKVDLIRFRTGLKPLTWIRKNSKGEIYGTIGSLFKWASLSEKNFGRCLQAFMAYSFYILPELSESQELKFRSAINPIKGDGLNKRFHKSFAQTVRRTIRRRPISCSGQPLVIYQGSPDKKAPRMFKQKSVPQNQRILDELQYFNETDHVILFAEFRRLYSPLLSGLAKRQELDYLTSKSPYGEYTRCDIPSYQVRGGEIHFLQEPGGKLRSVASPFRIHQEALRPLGNAIYDVVRSLPWDCTFDQTKAIPYIQSRLIEGGQVHSIDLSNATDHFPLSLQETALRAIFDRDAEDHIDLFIKISRGTWSSSIGQLQWTKGQPLGLYPSFGAFTLTHGLLLLHLAGDYHHQFFVVGDDIVIMDDELHNRYIAMLDRMSCPWSQDKSICSAKLAEFAGKIVTPTKVYPQLKWRNMSDDNFLDICRLLGRKSRSLLNKRQRNVFDHVAHLCEPIGLNQSLPGDNLEKMVMRTLSFYRPEKVVLGTLMGLRRRINSNIYSSTAVTLANELETLASTFDEKVKNALSQTLFSNWRTSISIGLEGLDTLPEALELRPRLPLREFASTRRSTLERYERILSQRTSS
jgi:hypothetical protein